MPCHGKPWRPAAGGPRAARADGPEATASATLGELGVAHERLSPDDLLRRWPQIAVLVLLLVMMWLVWRLMPANVDAPGSSFKGLGTLLRRSEVLRTLAMTLLYFTAIFSVFSYIGPVLLSLVPLSPAELSGTLVVFGLAGVAGTLSGGWANDRFGALPHYRANALH